MPKARHLFVLLCLLPAAKSQDPAQTARELMNARLDIQSASVTLRTVRNLSKASDGVKAEVDKLTLEGAKTMAAGKTGETRRLIFHALTLLSGQEWTPRQDFASSLLLRTDVRVADLSRPLVAHLDQVYAAALQPETGWRLRVSVHEGIPSRYGPTPGRLCHDGGILDGVTRDLIDEPFGFDTSLTGCGEGLRVLSAELLDGEKSVRKLWTGVHVVDRLEAQTSDIERRLKKISGHESAKATVMAPLDLSRQMNLGRRELARVDFAAELHQSETLLKELEAGRDPLLRATGNHRRHYVFTEAGEIMPYRVYVPAVYKPGAKLPLVMALHGLGGNEDTFLGRSGGMIQKLAEQHGFIVAAPLGYRINGGYGSRIRRFADAAARRSAELSEKDVLNVLNIVSEEYGTDPERNYLIGHSMGGGGTWFLGAKYAEKWAALAPIAGPAADLETYSFDRLKGIAVMVCHGDQDATVPVGASRTMVAEMKKRGMSPVYIEVPGASHASVVDDVMPKIFDFLGEHKRSH